MSEKILAVKLLAGAGICGSLITFVVKPQLLGLQMLPESPPGDLWKMGFLMLCLTALCGITIVCTLCGIQACWKSWRTK